MLWHEKAEAQNAKEVRRGSSRCLARIRAAIRHRWPISSSAVIPMSRATYRSKIGETSLPG